MTTTARSYFHVEGETDGVSLPAVDENRTTPTKEVTAPGDRFIDRIITVAAAGQAVLWDYTDAKDWAVLIVNLVGATGNIDLGLIYDSVDGSGVPTGTYPRARGVRLSCNTEFKINDPDAKIHPTAATDVGLTGNYPTRDTSGSSVAGKLIRGTAYNPGASSVAVRVRIVGGSV